MKVFTQKQKNFFVEKKIKVGSFYPFPMSTFSIYGEPAYGAGQPFEVSFFGKNLSGEFFRVTEIDGQFVKGNFVRNPSTPDFYLTEFELSGRPFPEIIFLFLSLSIPFMVYNLFKGLFTKKEKQNADIKTT